MGWGPIYDTRGQAPPFLKDSTGHMSLLLSPNPSPKVRVTTWQGASEGGGEAVINPQASYKGRPGMPGQRIGAQREVPS